MEKRLKIASWILVGLLLLPLFQQITGLAHVRKLRGAVSLADVPELTAEKWFDGSFQSDIEPAMNDRFGFRNLFVRVNNQIGFSLYRKALASGVVIGKENFMYEKNYILAQQGGDYMGDSTIAAKVGQLKNIQDYFEAQGKHMFIAFAAGKGSFYPEYFPDAYITEKGRTNLQEYTARCDAEGVNYIDFNAWFLAMKDTSRYCLYPRTGIHWSYYGMVQVIDSLNNYLGELSGQAMPQFEWGEVKETRKYRSSDADIEAGMNILFQVNHDKLAYPKVSFKDEGIDKLKGAVIADSFYWGLHNIGFSSRIFGEGEFWYYYKRIYASHLDEVIQVEEINALERLKEADVIILMCTEATLPQFPFGFEKVLEEI